MRTISAIAALAVVSAAAPHAAPDAPPKLAVLVVVDQMRADYVDRFSGEWTGGLKRMITQGAWYQRAAYPYLSTVTCAGHATVATGSFPHVHGVYQNAWWDRDERRMMTCTQDPHVQNFGYGGTVTGGDSGYRLLVPTFADQMRTSRKAHVVSISLKDRSAAILAGHGGDAVAWLTNTLEAWQSSSAFSEGPVPAVKAFVEANPIAADLGKTWEKMLPAASYTGPDDGVGEAPPPGWTRSFPHPLNGVNNRADGTFYAEWERSPFADEYVARFAIAMTEAFQLGKHDGTDVLAVSFSSPDLMGHAFGPHSHEVQDMYARLDRTIGTLFDALDEKVGKDQWVAGLTADHGVTPIPEQLVAEGRNAGRIDGNGIAAAIEEVLHPVMAPGRHVIAVNINDIYFEPPVFEKIRKSRELMAKVLGAIEARPGVQRVFMSDQLRDGAKSKDPLVRAAALSYVEGRSGDIIYAPKPGWMISAGGTTHGSANPDDQRVPILFLGAGIKPGVYQDDATPADLAPTLAAIAGLSMKAEGHALACIK